jgi:hypothetical protein
MQCFSSCNWTKGYYLFRNKSEGTIKKKEIVVGFFEVL